MTDRRIPHREFGPRSIEVGQFLLERRRAGDCTAASFEAVQEAFPELSFFDFLGGFIFADCAQAGTLRIVSQEEGRA
jgi:hypothetical protein